MRAPSLRFRQVFEHGTHFKVQKPNGETVTIAKKGLSPSTVGRLRRFAQGGEVMNLARGAQVSDPELALPDDVPAAPVALPAAPMSAAKVAAAEQAQQIAAIPTTTAGVKASAEANAEAQIAKDLSQRLGRQATPEDVAKYKAEPVRVFVPRGGELESTVTKDTPAEIAAQTAREVTTEERARAEAAPVGTPEERLRAEAGKAYGQARVQVLEEQAAQLRRAELIDAESKKIEAQIQEQNKRIEEDRGIIRKAEQDLSDMKNVGSYFSRLDTVSKIGTAVSLAAGALASGMTGGPNQALKMYESAVEADLDRQKRDQQSLLNRLVRAGTRIDQAEDVVRNIGTRLMANKLEAASAQVASAKAKEGLAQLGATLRNNAETRIEDMRKTRAEEAYRQGMLNVQRAELGLSREDQRRKDLELELEAAKLWQAGGKLAAEETKAMSESEQKEADRSFTVPGTGIQLKANSPPQARKAEEQILGQSDFINGANRVLAILKEHPYAVFVPGTQARQDAQLAMAQMLERYTKSERFGRPLNLTASRVIKTGLPDLGASGVLNQAFGDPTKVVEDLLADVKQSQALAVDTYGGKSSAQDRKAAIEALRRQHAPAIRTSTEE